MREWMRTETWLSAEEALALNFCDRIEGGESTPPIARFDFTRFQSAPEFLVRMARENGWATASPEQGKRKRTDA